MNKRVAAVLGILLLLGLAGGALFWRADDARNEARSKQIAEDKEKAALLVQQAEFVGKAIDLLLNANKEMKEGKQLSKETLGQLQQLIDETFPDLPKLPVGPIKVMTLAELRGHSPEDKQAYLAELTKIGKTFDALTDALDEKGRQLDEWAARGLVFQRQQEKLEGLMQRYREYRKTLHDMMGLIVDNVIRKIQNELFKEFGIKEKDS